MQSNELAKELGPHLRLLRRFKPYGGSWRLQVDDDDPDRKTLEDLSYRMVIATVQYHKMEYVGRGSGHRPVYEISWDTVGFLRGVEYMESLNPPREPEEFCEDQWWLKELDVLTQYGTPNQKRAVAVVRNMMAQLADSRAEQEMKR